MGAAWFLSFGGGWTGWHDYGGAWWWGGAWIYDYFQPASVFRVALDQETFEQTTAWNGNQYWQVYYAPYTTTFPIDAQGSSGATLPIELTVILQYWIPNLPMPPAASYADSSNDPPPSGVESPARLTLPDNASDFTQSFTNLDGRRVPAAPQSSTTPFVPRGFEVALKQSDAELVAHDCRCDCDDVASATFTIPEKRDRADPADKRWDELQKQIDAIDKERKSLARQYVDGRFGTESQFWLRANELRQNPWARSRPGDYLVHRFNFLLQESDRLRNEQAALTAPDWMTPPPGVSPDLWRAFGVKHGQAAVREAKASAPLHVIWGDIFTIDGWIPDLSVTVQRPQQSAVSPQIAGIMQALSGLVEMVIAGGGTATTGGFGLVGLWALAIHGADDFCTGVHNVLNPGAPRGTALNTVLQAVGLSQGTADFTELAISPLFGRSATDGVKKGSKTGTVDTAVSRVWPSHHPFPVYLGGAIDQTLKKMPRLLHYQFHSALDKWKGGKYARRNAEAIKNMDKAEIIKDLTEFYKTGEGGIFRRYLPDFLQAVRESGA